MEISIITGIATIISFYIYSNLSVYKTLYVKTHEEIIEVGNAKTKLNNLYNKQHTAYNAIAKSKEHMSIELNTSIEQYKEIKTHVNELEEEKKVLEIKIEQLYDTIGNS
jgi:seryl-tRNA synthetase